jgi:RNA polymerase-binding transcription factor DksA
MAAPQKTPASKKAASTRKAAKSSSAKTPSAKKPAPKKPVKPGPKKPAKASPKKPSKQPAKKPVAKKSKRAPKKPFPGKRPAGKTGATKPAKAKPGRAAKPAKAAPPAKKPAKKAPATKKAPAAQKAPAKTAAPAKAKPAPVAKKAPAPKLPPVKKAPPRKPGSVICPLSGWEVMPAKPNLGDRTLKRLRAKLIDEREQQLRQAEDLQAEAEELAQERDPGDTQFDEESGEGDTVNVERERDLLLSASARQIVDAIDRALKRMDAGTYGVCVPAGRRLTVERLEAIPYAEECVDCKARAERRR